MSAPRCLVLGGSGALGRVVCGRLAQSGARVALTYHRGEEVAAALARSLPGAHALPLDLRHVRSVEDTVGRAAELLGGLDALVQCAGVALTVPGASASNPQRLAGIDEAAYDAMFDVQAKGTFFACRAAAPLLARSGGGNIVLLGSVDLRKGLPAPPHFSSAKWALGGLARSLAKELGAANIRVNVVAPGMLEGGAALAVPANLRDEYLKHCGLRRVGTFAEAAEVVAFFALENTYVTGQIVPVDGAL